MKPVAEGGNEATASLPDATPPALDAFTLPTACKAPAALDFTPVLHAKPAAGLCTPDIFNSLFTACFDQETQTPSACAAAQELYPGSMACFSQCMGTEFTLAQAMNASTVWGGVIQRSDQPGLYFFNYGGCVAALDPTPEGLKCAKDFEALEECQNYACAGCAVPAMASAAQTKAYDDCELHAPCESFTTEINDHCPWNFMPGGTQTGPAGVCLSAAIVLEASTTTAQQATAAIRSLVAAICAPEVLSQGTDGGLDSGTDADGG